MLTMTHLGHDHMEPADAGAQLVGTQMRTGAFPHLDGCSNCSATVLEGSLFGLSQSAEQLEATADGVISAAGGAAMVSFIAIGNAMATLDKASAKQFGQILIAKGVSASSVKMALKSAFPMRGRSAIWGILATASAAASAYHGYKRNDSVGWAVVWFFLGGIFPVITPVVAVAQGFGKPK